MLEDLVGIGLIIAPFLALLAWRQHADRRQHAAALVRADVHAGARRALGGDSMLAINVAAPTLWRRGAVRLSAPTGYEPEVGLALDRVLRQVPDGFAVVIHCGGGA